MSELLVKGIDISKWQGKFDFNEAQANGYKFCFCKATEGSNVFDREFDRNWTEGPKYGFLVGAYHFFRPSVNATLQAEHFLDMIIELPSDALPCVLDWEVTDSVRNGEQIHGAKTWLEIVEKRTKKKPILYTSPSFADERGGLAEFKSYPLWIAHYGVSTPRVPKAWARYTFWQYSSEGSLDKNLFNGSMDELRALAGL